VISESLAFRCGLQLIRAASIPYVSFKFIPDTTQKKPGSRRSGLSHDGHRILYRLVQKYADSGFEGKVQVAFKIDNDFPVEAKDVAEKLESDSFLASFCQRENDSTSAESSTPAGHDGYPERPAQRQIRVVVRVSSRRERKERTALGF